MRIVRRNFLVVHTQMAVVNVKISVVAVIGVKRNTKESTLVTKRGATSRDAVYIQEGSRQKLIRCKVHNSNLATLLTDEEAIRVTRGVGNRDGVTQPVDHSCGVDALGVEDGYRGCGKQGTE